MNEISQNLPKKIEYSSHTLSDLEDIWSHIAQDNEEYANKTITKIIEKFSKLLYFPKIGKERNELFLGLRSLPIENYLIFYQETLNGIEIVRVIHGSRDIENLFDEMIPKE